VLLTRRMTGAVVSVASRRVGTVSHDAAIAAASNVARVSVRCTHCSSPHRALISQVAIVLMPYRTISMLRRASCWSSTGPSLGSKVGDANEARGRAGHDLGPHKHFSLLGQDLDRCGPADDHALAALFLDRLVDGQNTQV